MAKNTKNYKKVAELVDREKTYTIEEAIKLVKETSFVKFDPTVEIIGYYTRC